MGKGTELWDDSALINAFDNAMFTYKAMHSKTCNDDSPEEENRSCISNGKEPVFIEKTDGHVELEVKDTNLSNNATEMYVSCYNTETASIDLPDQENNLSADLNAPESHTQSLGVPCIDGKVDTSDQQTLDYNQLLRQYYELEEQKQKVAQQLQASYWNYQTPVDCTSQSHHAPAIDASEHGPQPACYTCSCHCLAVPSIPACATGGLSSGGYCCCSAWTACCSASHVKQCLDGHQCPAEIGICSIATSCMVNPTKHCPPVDDNVVKMGMMAAERAISSVQKEISAISSNVEEGKDKEEGSSISGGEGSLSNSSESNLSAVLGAWYAAGFQTGRYLMEQSKMNTDQ